MQRPPILPTMRDHDKFRGLNMAHSM